MGQRGAHDAHLEIDPDHLTVLQGAGLDSFDALMSTTGATSLAKKGLATWRERIVLDLDGRRLFLKRYSHPPLLGQLRERVRGFPAMAAVEHHWLVRMASLGIPAPRPVAVGWRRRGVLERESLLLTAEVPGESLERWVRGDGRSRLADRVERERIGWSLADLVAHLHGAGLFHRDLYLSHLFLDTAHGCAGPPALIDLQRMIRPRLWRRRWLIKDLAALSYSTPAGIASTADRLRWFLRYRRQGRLSPDDKALVRAVVAKTARIAHHSGRHGLG